MFKHVVLAICLLLPSLSHAQLVDLSKMKRLSKVAPVKSRAITIDGDAFQDTIDVSGNTLIQFEVTDSTALYRISLEALKDVGLTLHAYELELNDQNQATKKTLLLSDSSFGPNDRTATLPPALFSKGRIYLGMAGTSPVKATLRIDRQPAAQQITDASGSSKAPTAVSDDVSGPADGTLRCLRPAAFGKAGADTITLVTDPRASAQVQFYSIKAKRLGSHSSKGVVTVRGIKQGGPHSSVCVSVKKAGAASHWRLTMKPADPDRIIAEPDASGDAPTPIPVSTPILAPIDARDTDYYSVPQAGYFDLNYRTNTGTRVCLYQGRDGGRNIQECHDTRQVNIGPFKASAATRVTVTKRGGPPGLYELTLTPTAVDDAVTLVEPNSTPTWQREYSGAARLNGRLSGSGDVDSFALDTGETAQMWRFVVLGESVTQVVFKATVGKLAEVRRGGSNTRRLTTPDMYLEPGPVQVFIYGKEGPYKIIAKPLGAPLPTSELEPNQALPRRVSFGQKIIGTLPQADADKFSFFLHRDADMTFRMNTPAGSRTNASVANVPGLSRLSIPAGAWSKRVRVPAGEHVLSLTPRTVSPAEYELEFDYADPFDAPNKDAKISLAKAATPLQAFSVFQQRMTIPITIENTSARALTGNVKTWAARPQVRGEDVDVTVPANASKTVTVSLIAPPDLYAGPLATAFAFEVGGKAVASAMTSIEARADAASVNPMDPQPAPPEMLGGINVALSALGAKWIAADGAAINDKGDYIRGNPFKAYGFPLIIDGMAVQGQPPVGQEAFLSNNSTNILRPVLDLPGDEAIPIVGVGIDTRMKKPQGIRAFAIDVSLDGASWREVVRGTHEIWGRTAYYPFPGGTADAKFVRLKALDKRGSPKTAVGLNAFEVIAKPGASGLSGINLARKELGALTSSLKTMRASRWMFLDQANETITAFTQKANPTDANAAITFKNTMAADVAGVELVLGDPDGKNKQYAMPTQAIVFASPKGGTGPWREVARKDLPQTHTKGQTVKIPFPEIVTAKAIKVDYAHSAKGRLRAPASIRVIERAEDDTYRSVLGLWGEWAAQRAAKQPQQLAMEDPGEGPTPLAATGDAMAQTVEFGKDEDTWRIAVPKGSNTVRVSLTGSAGFDPSVIAKDSAGKTLTPLEVIKSDFLDDVTYVYAAKEGSHIDVTVAEQQRSTVFLVDQSASVASYIPRIRRAIVDYADDMVKGRDAVQFRVLGRDWPQEAWFTDPVPLRSALVRYPGGGNSSAEAGLVSAADKLKDQDGSRAIVIITDADAGADANLMRTLEAARARVFAIKVSSGGMWQNPMLSRPTAQLWAGQTGGEVTNILQSDDISVAYARASARLLGPKPYSIAAELDTRVVDPGLLKVAALSADTRTKSLDSMLIIFDASGSMLKRLDGTRRIKLAKGAVQGLFFEDRLDSSKTQIGLRVFGGPPDSCETALVEPLKTNNMVTLAKAVNAIRPQNNARTAIGASLLAAKTDLQASGKGTSSNASILLITDGEETCGGDPLAAIQSLRDAGIDTRIDVVSFALEPEIDRRTFENWAKAGDGIYADAQNAKDLQAALATAIQARFEVVQGGAVIASGLTGGPEITLAPGRYSLRAAGTQDGQSFTIAEGQTASLRLK